MNLSFRQRITKPVSVYINWAAYDELSDNIRLNEAIAFEQFEQMLRLKAQGVHFDYYLMDCFWFSKDGGYREWRKPDWSEEGPGRFLNLCQEHNVKPGIWVSTNFRVAGEEYWFLDVIPEWQDSLATHGRSFCLFHGGYLNHFMESLQLLVNQGFKMIKFDFADFDAATPEVEKTHTREEIRENNISALLSAFKIFRYKNPDVLFLAYNGYGGEYTNTSIPFTQNIDLRWLEVFDSLYCGDPRFSDIPFANFWRSKDHYTDHMVKQYEFNGVPLKSIDNCAFIFGNTGTCYHRGKAGWKASLLLSLARGGYTNTYYGDLKLFDDKEAEWFASAQKLFHHFQEYGRITTFGGIPGEGNLYGYLAEDPKGEIITLVNPGQNVLEFNLEQVIGNSIPEALIIFADMGYEPKVVNNVLSVGPEQMVVLGLGEYSDQQYYLGKGDYNVIVEKQELKSFTIDGNSFNTEIDLPANHNVQIFIQQFEKKTGLPLRSSGGGEPHGTKLDQILKLSASQDNHTIPFKYYHDKAIWSGLSWMIAEIKNSDIKQDSPLQLNFKSTEPDEVKLQVQIYLT
ncbi:MAG: hypothetical protein ACNS62_12600 [Candidatus Cyclobacteriaceae bacterium M3_2C_046]